MRSELTAHHLDGDRLVGREELLVELLERMRRGDHLVLRGPAGVGKTRLAGELSSRLGDTGRRVERLLASTGTSTYHLGLFAGTYGHPTGVGPGDIGMLFDSYLGHWRSDVRRAGPTLLWVDDAPHVDDLSASLLRQATIDGLVQLVLTARSDDTLPPDLHALVVEGRVDPVDVPPLGAADSAELARLWSPGHLSVADAREVFRLSGGFPLFVRELVRHGDPRDHRSAQLDRLVEMRVERLSPAERRLAEMVAASEPVGHTLFEPDLESLVHLLRSGLVTWHDEHRLRLEHPYYADYLLDGLGPLRSTAYADLVDRADGHAVDPVLLAQWTVLAGRTPDAELAEAATRLALGNTDVAVARRLVDHAGPAAALLRAECLIAEGEVDEGLQELERVRTSDLPMRVRVEAASSASRHLGLTRGDQHAAHRILSSIDRADLERRLRELLLLGRLWLWLFGPRTDDAGMELIDDLLTESSRADWVTFELLSASTAVRYQWAGPAAAERIMRRTLEIEPEVGPSEFALARTRSVEASFRIHDGDLRAGLDILESAATDPGLGSATSIRLVGGNIALIAALGGDFERAAAAAATVRQVVDVDQDPFRFAEIARLTHLGNFAVAGLGPDPATWPVDPPPVDGVRTLELMLWLRYVVLADPSASIDDGVATLVECGALGWLVFLYTDVGDRRQAAIHRLVRDALDDIDRRGVWSAAHRAASARCNGDSDALVGAGAHLLEMGFVSGATRAFADVARTSRTGSPVSQAAIRGLTRALRRWKGPRPEWIQGLPVPTDRQLAVAERLVSGRTVGGIADELGLSTRTVENHIYRTARSLGVSGQRDLVRCLTG
ncbi:MAG: LuxR C-terminal-related transcriptional regulator [Ilumatobacteraceae bacterium]